MPHTSPLDLDAGTMRSLSAEVTNLIVDHLAGIRNEPALGQHRSPSDPVLPLGRAPASGVEFSEILDTLHESVFPFHAREPHPGFMAYVPSAPTFPALLGDWIATAYNFYAGVWPVATGPNRVEVVVLDWFRQWLSMPEGSGGLLTTGGSAANLTAIVAARHRATNGRADAIPRLAMYTSVQAHSSVARAGWIAGIDRSMVRSIPCDAGLRMDTAALRQALASDLASGLLPCAVVASAGTTNTGAVDPLNEIADICEEFGVWLHVDAAYGGFAVLTERGRKALDGIGRADSVTMDPHKWLYVPFECGCLMVREPRRLSAAFAIFAEYLKDVQGGGDDGRINFADYGEQLTRYNRAMKVWVNVKYFGTNALAAAIDRNMDLAKRAEARIRATPGLEVLSPAALGIVCFRALPQGGSEDPDAVDRWNEGVLARVNAGGRYFISSTRLNGKLSLRICVLGFRTDEGDIDGLVDACAGAGG